MGKIRIGKNIYKLFSKALEDYCIYTSISDNGDGDAILTFSAELTVDCYDSEEFRETVEIIKKALEIFNYLESLDIVFVDEEVETLIVPVFEVPFEDGNYERVTEILKDYEPKPDLVKSLDAETITKINRSLELYHKGFMTQEETLMVIKDRFFGKD